MFALDWVKIIPIIMKINKFFEILNFLKTIIKINNIRAILPIPDDLGGGNLVRILNLAYSVHKIFDFQKLNNIKF